MSYWGAKPEECDTASLTIGTYVLLIKERLFEGAQSVIDKKFPEQSIVASVRCLRLLDAGFPGDVRLVFAESDLEKAKDLFVKWYSVAKGRIPAKYRARVREEGEAEFRLYEQQHRELGLPPPEGC